jgi:hypothetical protein
MRRDPLLLTEIIEATERIVELSSGQESADIGSDRDRRDTVLWNFTDARRSGRAGVR